MILGTHNTMSYRKPKQWFLRPVKFLARCQAIDYKEQHEKFGVDCFDLRLYWNKNNELEFRHSFFRYDASDFYEILDYCNNNHMYIRILLDPRPNSENIEQSTANFKKICEEIEKKYTNIKFYNGKNVLTWETLYDFEAEVTEIGFYSSVTSFFKSKSKFLSILDDWCPWFYAKLKNHKNRLENDERYKDDNICVQYDFIEIK